MPDLISFLAVAAAAGGVYGAMRMAGRASARRAAMLSGALSASLDAIVVMDHDGCVVDFSGSAETMFGYARAQALGRAVADLIVPPTLRQRHRDALARYLSTGKATILNRRLEIRACRADGTEFPVELTVVPVAGSSPPLFTAAIRDLTEHLRIQGALRESEQRFRTLVEGIRDYAIFMTDANRRATSWNEGVQRVLGFAEGEFVGRDVVPLIFTPEDIRDGVADREFAKAAQEGAASDDRWMIRKDGSRIFVLGVTLARRDESGAFAGFAKIMRDRTEHKRLETELRRTAEELARANQRQTEFLATLSHELRNPLAPIRNGLELLRRGALDEAAESRTHEMMSRQVEHVVRLVDDLLDLSRITTGKIHLRAETMDLAAALAQAVEAVRAQCMASRVELEVRGLESPFPIQGDPTRIVQIGTNLLNNSCKFTPAGGRVQLLLAREGDEAVIRVRDTGEGIQPDHLQRIFDMFEQIERPIGPRQGLGIGLGLTRRLVELHGGTIVAHSAGPNRGSEFVVRLPAV